MMMKCVSKKKLGEERQRLSEEVGEWYRRNKLARRSSKLGEVKWDLVVVVVVRDGGGGWRKELGNGIALVNVL